MTVSEIVELILSKVKGVKEISGGYQFKCPAHDDKKPSAALYPKDNGVALKCNVGCTTLNICEAIGIRKSDLFIRRARRSFTDRITATYRYYDADGNLLYEHLRLVYEVVEGKQTLEK
jgi:hypothetical protein